MDCFGLFWNIKIIRLDLFYWKILIKNLNKILNVFINLNLSNSVKKNRNSNNKKVKIRIKLEEEMKNFFLYLIIKFIINLKSFQKKNFIPQVVNMNYRSQNNNF